MTAEKQSEVECRESAREAEKHVKQAIRHRNYAFHYLNHVDRLYKSG